MLLYVQWELEVRQMSDLIRWIVFGWVPCRFDLMIPYITVYRMRGIYYHVLY